MLFSTPIDSTNTSTPAGGDVSRKVLLLPGCAATEYFWRCTFANSITLCSPLALEGDDEDNDGRLSSSSLSSEFVSTTADVDAVE